MKQVVTCFLKHDSKILILRRSQNVGSFRGKWAGVSGFVESTPDEQAFTEITEETRLSRDDVELVKTGLPLEVEGEGKKWLVHPYLFIIKDKGKIEADWEHNELKWIEPHEIKEYDTVPMLKEALARVYEFE